MLAMQSTIQIISAQSKIHTYTVQYTFQKCSNILGYSPHLTFIKIKNKKTRGMVKYNVSYTRERFEKSFKKSTKATETLKATKVSKSSRVLINH